MNKQPIALISNDWHIKEDNCQTIERLVEDQCKLAVKLKLKEIYCLGDIFNSRKSQTLQVLQSFHNILETCSKYDITLVAFPGNHDKVDGTSEQSFLDPFRDHPNLSLITRLDVRKLSENVGAMLIPFFKEEQWLDIFNRASSQTTKEDNFILFSHIAVNGSTNNDGTKVESSIAPTTLKGFKKVFLGHYHNTQEVTKNIIHLPSIQQNNFGEDTNKGYTILYDDLSYEIVRSDFKVFRKVIIDADRITKEELNEAIHTYQKQSETENIRFVFEGSEDKLKSINKERFYQVGIDVQMKNKDIEIVEDFDTVEITQYDSENIIEEFEEFCETNSYDLKEGLSYLK